MAKYIPIYPGSKYGCYTVIGKADKAGSQEFYKVRCDCGSEWVIGKTRLKGNPIKCRNCFGKEYTAMMMNKRREMVGQIINGFRILEVVPSKRSGEKAKFLTECIICGNRSKKTIS